MCWWGCSSWRLWVMKPFVGRALLADSGEKVPDRGLPGHGGLLHRLSGRPALFSSLSSWRTVQGVGFAFFVTAAFTLGLQHDAARPSRGGDQLLLCREQRGHRAGPCRRDVPHQPVRLHGPLPGLCRFLVVLPLRHLAIRRESGRSRRSRHCPQRSNLSPEPGGPAARNHGIRSRTISGGP